VQKQQYGAGASGKNQGFAFGSHWRSYGIFLTQAFCKEARLNKRLIFAIYAAIFVFPGNSGVSKGND